MCRDREVQREGTYETRASQRRMWHGLIQIVRTPSLAMLLATALLCNEVHDIGLQLRD